MAMHLMSFGGSLAFFQWNCGMVLIGMDGAGTMTSAAAELTRIGIRMLPPATL